MSDLHFFMSRLDTEEFIAWLIEQFRPSFILDKQPTEPLPTFTALDDVRACIAESQGRPRFLVVSELWQCFPISVSKICHNDGTTAHYINQRYGGPGFDFIPSRQGVGDTGDFIGGGSFGDYPSYYIQRGSPDPFPRPAAMTEAFRSAQSYMRRLGRRTTSAERGHSGGWALPGARAAHVAGAWLRLGDFHFHPTEVHNQGLMRTGLKP
jgi:hypothetical protein